MKKVFFLIIMLTFLIGCSKSKVGYNVKAYITSEKGYAIVIYDFPDNLQDPQSISNNINIDNSQFVEGAISPDPQTYTWVAQYNAYPGKKMSDQITLNFRYVKLDDCDVNQKGRPTSRYKGKETILEQTTYIKKSGCKIIEPFDKIYTKTVDLSSIKNSETLQLLGKGDNKSSEKYWNRANIYFRFYDEGRVEVSVHKHRSNVW